MDLITYKQRREQALAQEPKFRQLCLICRQPDFTCFCEGLRPFDPQAIFAILTHPVEVRRRIATGRMAHLTLQNSKLVVGHTFSVHAQLNSLLENPEHHALMLYPGRNSKNLSRMSVQERQEILPNGKKPVFVIIDGTWGTAKTMVNQSENLKRLPRICFTPTSPSNFRVRKQPRVDCYSTIEAIHHMLELLGLAFGFATENREHDALLSVFDQMVNRQLELAYSLAPQVRQAVTPPSLKTLRRGYENVTRRAPNAIESADR